MICSSCVVVASVDSDRYAPFEADPQPGSGPISGQARPGRFGSCCRKMTLRTRTLLATLSPAGIHFVTGIRCALECAC